MLKHQYVQPPRVFFGGKRFTCSVRPRYSCGSGAMVNDHIALKVAEEEKADYLHCIEGVYGEAHKKRAETLGLRGIAVAMAESGKGKNFRWLIFDLVTGECYRRPDDLGIEQLGFSPYRALSERTRQEITKTGRPSDYDRTFWKQGRDGWEQYQPEMVRVEPDDATYPAPKAPEGIRP
jgi:hypothetical protein